MGVKLQGEGRSCEEAAYSFVFVGSSCTRLHCAGSPTPHAALPPTTPPCQQPYTASAAVLFAIHLTCDMLLLCCLRYT